jgi:hypothetical protein
MDVASLGLSLVNELCITWVGKVRRKRDGREIRIDLGEYQLDYEKL